ncbi:hypothetical protein FHS51_001384 [Sphingobium wenxiniae]|uniref:Uncharacterized protein n=1 Tax=Sphingobium wenxiniae (strain DSM 21828 / CGMCC 1.7748 / JZ-1) TaxID=595605 RepID=A0A562KKT8_SPHWJ|nr:hypothetical protein [Sphingobium wenxiniae]MBB6191162.1 hypothetical protein [Sphingobium wenxiniae]TWH96038.1 hypothetical protein IQ35_01127 [Sphingobium wenxiniae]
MSRETIPVIACDRCRLRLEVREEGQDKGWGRAWASAPHADPAKPMSRQIGGDTMQADLCPACVEDLFAWWTSPPAREDAIPAAPPARKKPSRRRLADIVDQALREQATESIDAIREQPTSILSGEIVPGALAGVEMRARRIARELSEELD